MNTVKRGYNEHARDQPFFHIYHVALKAHGWIHIPAQLAFESVRIFKMSSLLLFSVAGR